MFLLESTGGTEVTGPVLFLEVSMGIVGGGFYEDELESCLEFHSPAN